MSGADPAAYADVETSSAEYARRFAGSVGGWFLDVQARATLELLAPWPGARVLDVGGGHAQLAGPLAARGHAVTVLGSDRSCAERLPAGTAFEAGDLLQAPFADLSFDAVLCFRLLPHIGRWRELVGELCRLAARVVVVDYPTARSLNALSGALFGVKKKVEKDTRPFTVFHEAEITAAFQTAGFERTGRRPQFFLPMALHRALRVAPLSRCLEATAGALGLVRSFGSPVILRAERRG